MLIKSTHYVSKQQKNTNTKSTQIMEGYEDVKGYEGKYYISRDGILLNKSGKQIGFKNADGYINVTLHQNGKDEHIGIHRIVARQFLPNPENKPQVNHINGDKTDNSAVNLEWSTAKENMVHFSESGLYKNRRTKVKRIVEKPEKYSFKKGYMSVKQIEAKEVKESLMRALKIKNRTSWIQRLSGEIEPKVSEARAIEAVFREYGITEIWGE